MNSEKKSYRAWRWAPWLGALSMFGSAACAQILGLEEWNGGSTSGGGGAPSSSSSVSSSSAGGSASSSSASSSSASSSSASSSSASSSSASGPDGGCNCGNPPECMIYSCSAGCSLQPAPGGTPCGMNKTCDWAGNCLACTGANPCADGCIDQGESDLECGGPFCSICPKGKHCNGNMDCLAPITCQNGLCQP